MSFMAQRPTLILVQKPACLLLILLITIFVGRQLADATTDGFISIDCGASADYKDLQTGIDYKSDSNYIDAGKTHDISPDFTTQYFRQQIKKLRSFPEGDRNCYTLKPERGRDNNYLIRSIFCYGNYDGKNKTPSFDLYLGVNKFATINGSFLYYEMIHVPSRDYIDVCLVNTGNGVPYISALELRPLDNSAYKVDANALLSILRYDYGVGSDVSIRYPDDLYDRIWRGKEFDGWTSISTNKTIYTQSSDDVYKIPAKVLSTAAELMKGASVGLGLEFSPPNDSSNCYVYLHFAEIQKLQNEQQRELRINFDGKRYLTESFKLDYLKPETITPNDPPIRGARVYFRVEAAEGSELPPILNAVEVYVSVDLPNLPTALDDVDAIMEMKKRYGVTKNWQGDPCVPSNFLWAGLNCSVDSTPRITSLNLSSSNLNGEIPDSISKFQALQSLDLSYNKLIGPLQQEFLEKLSNLTVVDLSYNKLTGPLPEILGDLPNLRVLNLRGNRFEGSVPDALIEKSKTTLQLSLEENPDLCLPASCHEKKEKFVIPVIASVSGVLLTLLLLTALAIYRRKKQRAMVSKSKKEGSLRSRNRPFTYSEIVSITENFRTTIGEGGFGRVYHGILKDGTEVAVKMLCPSSKQGYKEFRAEAQLLMIVHHRNLVYLIGYCDEPQHMALVYEYMSNGNLKEHLSERNINILNWSKRLQIAVDTAHGLEYLHNGCRPPIVHRDLKTSNILLNQNMQAKIADFGLSRAFVNESGSHLSTSAAGTPGYFDPEFHTSGVVNKKSDVYSFGIILFELITGRPAMMRRAGINTHIVQWVSPIIESGDIQSIVDPRLEGDFEINSAWKMVEIAMLCVAALGIQRPDMSDVLAELKECSGRAWMMHGNTTRLNNSLSVTYLEPDSLPSSR